MKIETADPRHRNHGALYWHTFFLGITMTFTELNTVMPALILEVGGSEQSVGILTAIMIGLPLVTQLIFAAFLHTRNRKKPYLLLGINLRVLALAMAAGVIGATLPGSTVILLVYLAMSLFALSGAFAGISYTEMLGKTIALKHRGRFFVRRQVFNSLGVLISAIITRYILGRVPFPEGYVGLFGAAAAVLLVASGGFWVLREPDAESARPGPGPAESRGAGAGGSQASPITSPGAPTDTAPREAILPLVRRTLADDRNLRRLIVTTNLIAPAFTAIPLVTALAHRNFAITGEIVGWFVLVQIAGMLLSSRVWSAVIRRGGFRLVLWSEAVLLGILLPLALLLAGQESLALFGTVYLLIGATISAHRVGTEAVIVQISPDHQRAIYAGIFGAFNIAMALVPVLTGTLIARLGFTAVFLVAAVAAWSALISIRGIWCGHWYAETK